MASDPNCLNRYDSSSSQQIYCSVESYVYRSTLPNNFHKDFFFNLLKTTCTKSWWMSIFLQNIMHKNMTLLLWWEVNCSSVWISEKVPLSFKDVVHWNHEMELRIFFFLMLWSSPRQLSSPPTCICYDLQEAQHWHTWKTFITDSQEKSHSFILFLPKEKSQQKTIFI